MYKYTHFIPQNTAPNGAKSIGVYDGNGKKVCDIPLGRMTPPASDKSYSFGMISDVHISQNLNVAWNPITKFDNALAYFENQGCVFCCVSGDLTQTGFYLRTNESDASTTYLDEGQFVEYKKVCDKHTIPVYEICGNHESYYGMPITNNLDRLEAYTGEEVLDYTIPQGDDLFIFIGQPHGSKPMGDNTLQWLYEILEANRNKRCFVFVHPHISSGNPLGAYSSNPIFEAWGTKTTVFKNLLNHYKNTILFHGHTHTKFECQEVDSKANYNDADGFKSVHVPSLGRPRKVIDGVLSNYIDAESEGCMVDVYSNYIILNGMDFINNEYVPLGTYKIDTTLQTIPAHTFTDSTGTIITNGGDPA